MYVTKRGNKFRAWERYNVNGKIKKISVTMDRDTPQARKKAARQLAEKIGIPTSGLTYSELVEAYIAYQKATLKPSTCTRNEASLKRLEDVFGDVKLERMTSGYISRCLLKKTTNPGTYNEYLKRVKAMFRWAYRNDYLETSACVDKIRPLKEDLTKQQKVADKFLEADELKKLLAEASPFYSLVFEFLALSGLRIGELIALDNKDVTETDIIVRKTYDSINDVMNTPKTVAGWRYVHIQPELADCIRRIRLLSRQHCLIAGRRPPYFVINVFGDRLSYRNAEYTFKKLCVHLFDRPLSLHSLRHSHVALMAEQGVDLDAISRRCGHSNSRITREIYYHVTRKQQEKDNASFDSVSIFA